MHPPSCAARVAAGTRIAHMASRALAEPLPTTRRYKVDVEIFPGTHNQEDQVNKQLADHPAAAPASASGPLGEWAPNALRPVE